MFGCRFKIELEVEREANKRLIEDVALSRQNVRDCQVDVLSLTVYDQAAESKDRLAKENLAAGQQLKEELAAMKARAEAEAQAEKERRDEMIRQIRALESVKLPHMKAHDSAKRNAEVLGQMSNLELQERLAALKVSGQFA